MSANVTQLVDDAKVAAPASTTPASTASLPSALNTAALPDDPVLLKQMIDELVQALRRERHDREEVQQQLDAFLQRLYGPRPAATNPDQGLLFPDEPAPTPPTPPTPPPEDKTSKSRNQSKPHGRRRPERHLRRAPRRYELTMAERLCPVSGISASGRVQRLRRHLHRLRRRVSV